MHSLIMEAVICTMFSPNPEGGTLPIPLQKLYGTLPIPENDDTPPATNGSWVLVVLQATELAQGPGQS